MKLLLQILTLIGSVAMLMYGMKVMSEGLQKMAGSNYLPSWVLPRPIDFQAF